MNTSPSQLRKILGRREVLGLAFGAMIGWSWVVLSGEMKREKEEQEKRDSLLCPLFQKDFRLTIFD